MKVKDMREIIKEKEKIIKKKVSIVLKELEDKGAIKEISEMLGHSKITTTYHYYIKASDTEKRNLVNQLNTLLC